MIRISAVGRAVVDLPVAHDFGARDPHDLNGDLRFSLTDVDCNDLLDTRVLRLEKPLA